jgi:endo-1,4-beta-xylanase
MDTQFIMFRVKILLIGVFSVVFFSCSTPGDEASSSRVTTSSVGTINGYTYEFWNQDEKGSPSMGLKSDGTFDVSWSGIFNMLARNGVRPGQNVQSVSYNVSEYSVSSGVSYLCVYGWAYDGITYDNMVEFYIVENWKNYRPPGAGGTLERSVVVDGDTYDIYTSPRVDQPSVHPSGNSTFTQYWSVRRDGDQRSRGTVDVASHFQAWSNLGMEFGDTIREVSFCIEGYQGESDGTGHANVSHLSFNRE